MALEARCDLGAVRRPVSRERAELLVEAVPAAGRVDDHDLGVLVREVEERVRQAGMKAKPSAFICASATGIYGDRDDETLDEQSESGGGFLAGVCREWEKACEPANKAGVRVVNLRFGPILAREGGMLAKLLTPFKMGMGGKVGSGRQFISWISIDDAVGATKLALDDQSMRGPINVVSPNPVTNEEFTKTLGHVLNRPTALAMPAFAARLAFGEMADEMLLVSQRVMPRRLNVAGFEFNYPDLGAALRKYLG